MFQRLQTVSPGQQSTQIATVEEPAKLDAKLIVELTMLFKSLAIKGATPGDSELNFRLYGEALAGLPFDRLQKVLRRYRVGSLGDGKWCPRPAEIHQEVTRQLDAEARGAAFDRLVEAQLAERRRLREERESRTDEERESVQRMCDATLAELERTSGRDRATSKHRQPTADGRGNGSKRMIAASGCLL